MIKDVQPLNSGLLYVIMILILIIMRAKVKYKEESAAFYCYPLLDLKDLFPFLEGISAEVKMPCGSYIRHPVLFLII